jgi:flagellar biosynthesis protein FlhF
MREALVRAKYELGKDALIISQITVRPGKWYNPFRKKMLEVTVAIEDDIHEKNTAEKDAVARMIADRQKRIEEAKVQEKQDKDRRIQVFGQGKLVQARWKDYCEHNAIPEDRMDDSHVHAFIREAYMENAFTKELKLGKVNVLVGPTGVGKTTTIAKIASREFLMQDRTVGLITIDTYRIAAVEQLRKYARILGIPCETVKEPSEMKAKLRKLRNCEMILIDTVGASPKDEDRIEDIKAYIDEIEEETNTYLTLSMSSDVDTNSAVLKKYRTLGYRALILTKFDEVRNYSNFWNLMENNLLPVQYFCFGQNVPEDLEESTLENVLAYLGREVAND